jgi:DNA-binding LacI/PurR family transcriptional regulator
VTRRNPGHRAQLADVARLARVSLSTASKILNDVPGVSARPETRRRVLRAAQTLGYQPHVTARALAGVSSHAIALLVPELTNPVHSKMIRGAFSQAQALGYTVLVAEDFEGQEADDSFSKLVAAGHVDGMLVASARSGHPLLESLIQQGIPHVFINRQVDGSDRNITMRLAAASRLAVDHFADLGHKMIGHVAGPRDVATGLVRAAAFTAATEVRGIRPAPIAYTSFDESGGATGASLLLAHNPNLTAIFASSLSQAVGVVHTVHQKGLRIPEDISILAYDDLPLADFLWPPLDTVSMPLSELGRAAVDALVAQINGAAPQDVEVPIDPRLVLRGSSASPSTDAFSEPSGERSSDPVQLIRSRRT